jgi:serine/threonine protein kinase
LSAPGLRGIVRPQEGIGFAELRPEAYDYLAPERVASGSPPDVVGDLYACGALCWHLLAGRPPIAGGNARAKLHAIQAARVIDVRSIAQGVSGVLAEAIAQCLASDRSKRPTSFAQLAEMLGPPTDAGRELLASLQRSPS